MDKNLTQQRTCCVCSTKLHGRSDKVFCNISCKNKYHGAIRKHNKTVSAETIKKLNKNYQILCFLLGEEGESFTISRLELIRLGFQMEIVSGIELNLKGVKCKIYEFSFYFLKNSQVFVRRDNKQSNIAPYVYRRWKLSYCLNNRT